MAIFKSPELEGPGVSKNEAEKRGVFRFIELFLRYYGSLLATSLLKFLFDILVIPAGLGAIGSARIARIAARDRHCFISDFFGAIRKNKWQALASGIINNILSGCAIFSLYFIWNENAVNEDADGTSFLMLSLSIVALVFITFIRLYTPAVLLTFNVTLGQLYKNALLLAIGGFGRNLIILISHIAVYGIVAAPMLLDFHVGLGIAGMFYLMICLPFSALSVQYNIFPVMMKYLIRPFMENNPGEGENTLRELGLTETDEESVFSEE